MLGTFLLNELRTAETLSQPFPRLTLVNALELWCSLDGALPSLPLVEILETLAYSLEKSIQKSNPMESEFRNQIVCLFCKSGHISFLWKYSLMNESTMILIDDLHVCLFVCLFFFFITGVM